jgi:HK97 family phage portal protein
MLAGLFGREERSISSVPWQQHPDSGWGVWPGGDPASGSMPLSARSSLQLLTVYGCVQLITNAISKLPVDSYRDEKLGDGKVRKVEVAKPAWLEQPTPDLSWNEWCGQVLVSLLLHGNAYVAVQRGASGLIVEIPVLDPTVVTPFRNGPGDRKRYRVNGVELPGLEVLHVKGMMLPGSDVGVSPVEAARQSIGLGLTAVRYGAQFFENEANMPGVIEAPGAMQPDTMTNLAQQWRRKRSTGGRGLPGVLQGGATWKPTGVTNEQAQFLATRNFTAAEIAGQMFLVDPADIGIGVQGNNQTYANIEQRNVHRLQVTYLPWIVTVEKAVSALLARPRYVKLNVDGLLRGDMKTRYEAYEIGLRSKFLVPNEPREKEDLTPLPGGDEVAPTAPAVPPGGGV